MNHVQFSLRYYPVLITGVTYYFNIFAITLYCFLLHISSDCFYLHYTGTGLDDGAVTPNKLISGAGSSWVWQTWSPTVTAASPLTINSLTIVQARFIRIGKSIVYNLDVNVTLGGSPAASLFFTLPTEAYHGSLFANVGTGFISNLSGWVQLNNSYTQAILRRYDNGSISTGSTSFRASGVYESV